MTQSAWDWRGRAEELRSADGSDEAKARQYGAATKLLKEELPLLLRRRVKTSAISAQYGVSQSYVERLARQMKAEKANLTKGAL